MNSAWEIQFNEIDRLVSEIKDATEQRDLLAQNRVDVTQMNKNIALRLELLKNGVENLREINKETTEKL